MELTGGAEAARWEEMRNPNEWRRKLPVEAASELNDWLGAIIHDQWK